MPAIEVSPSTIRAKYSDGPNFVAKLDTTGARDMNNTTDIVPPMTDARQDMPRAFPAFPCRAMGYPSRVVIMAAESPGVLIRIEVMEPPYMAP